MEVSRERELPLSHNSHQSIIIVHFTAPASPAHGSSEIRRVRPSGFGKIIRTQSQTSCNCSTMVFCVYVLHLYWCTETHKHLPPAGLNIGWPPSNPFVLLQSTISLFIWALLTGSLLGVWDKRPVPVSTNSKKNNWILSMNKIFCVRCCTAGWLRQVYSPWSAVPSLASYNEATSSQWLPWRRRASWRSWRSLWRKRCRWRRHRAASSSTGESDRRS